LVFKDDFTSSISPFWWLITNGTHTIGNCEEEQWYIPQNCFLRDGRLVLKAKREDYTPPGKSLKHFTSGAIASFSNFRYGYIEARVKIIPPVPKYQEYEDIQFKKSGFWPAFWVFSGAGTVLGGTPEYQEFDIFEYFGKILHYESTTHLGDNHYIRDFTADHPKDFHTYGLEWTQTSSNYFLDGTMVASIPIPTTFTNRYCQIWLNAAVGCTGGTTDPNKFTYPAELEIDYVKVFQRITDMTHIESLYPLPASGLGRGYKVCVNQENTFVISDFPGTTVNFSGSGLGFTVSPTTESAFFDYPSYSKITGGNMFKSCRVTAQIPGVYMLAVDITDLAGRTHSDNIHIEVLAAPSAPVSITSNKLTCNRYELTTSSIAGADQYVWEYGGQTEIAGNSIIMVAPFSGNVSVTAVNSANCSSGKYTKNMNLGKYLPKCSAVQLFTANKPLNSADKTKMVFSRADELDETDLLNTNNLNISPNPFKNEINIRFSNEEETNNITEVQILDILGKAHLKQKVIAGNNVLITNDLPNGTYFLKVTKNGQVQNSFRKLIKAN
jgi:beta-glucanase (GH16 family)